MQTKRTRTLALSLLVLCVLPWSARAVPLGIVDSGEYPYVGLAAMDSVFGSGVLVSPNVVLTAAHVADLFQAGSSLFVTGNDAFDADAIVNIVDSVVHPLYDPDMFGNPFFDYGLLFLEEAVTLAEYAALLPADPVSLLGDSFEVAGYGGTLERRVDTGVILDVQGNLLVTAPIVEPGDSGGGLFIEVGGQNVLAGITSFKAPGTDFFASVGFARTFIDQYVADVTWFGESAASDPPLAVTEPASLPMLAFGLLVLLATRRKRHRRPLTARFGSG